MKFLLVLVFFCFVLTNSALIQKEKMKLKRIAQPKIPSGSACEFSGSCASGNCYQSQTRGRICA
jgi:hypothetical protein